jgi:hypothetical protein
VTTNKPTGPAHNFKEENQPTSSESPGPLKCAIMFSKILLALRIASRKSAALSLLKGKLPSHQADSASITQSKYGKLDISHVRAVRLALKEYNFDRTRAPRGCNSGMACFALARMRWRAREDIHRETGPLI